MTMLKAQSDKLPQEFVKSRGKTQANYNVREVEMTDEAGKPKTVYEYTYVVIEGKVTKGKVLAAIQAQKLEEDDATEWTTDAVVAAHDEAENEFNVDLGNMTHDDRDVFIDSTITTIAGTRKYLKDLSRIVFAMEVRK